MKTAAYIFTFLIGFLTLQPVDKSQEKRAEMQCCSKDRCINSKTQDSDKIINADLTALTLF